MEQNAWQVQLLMEHQINLTNIINSQPLKSRFFATKSTQRQGIIVFIHGYGTTSSYHDLVISDFTSAYDYYTIELSGHGISVANPKWIDQRVDCHDNVELICATIKNLINNQPFYLIGHSMGGALATRVANQLGKQVLAYVSVCPMNSHLITWKSFKNYFSFAPKTLKQCTRFVKKLVCNQSHFSADLIAQEFQYQRFYHDFFHALKKSMYRYCNHKRSRFNEQALQIPTLAIAAQNDQLISAKSVQKSFKNHPYVQTIVLANSGHLVFWDQKQTYVQLVLDWFNHH